MQDHEVTMNVLKTAILAALLLIPLSLAAQVSNPQIIIVSADPSGTTPCNLPWRWNALGSGDIWYPGSPSGGSCTWTQLGSGGGGTGNLSGTLTTNSPLYGSAVHTVSSLPTNVFGSEFFDGAGDIPTIVPPFAVDVTQAPYNAKCDGHSDDSAAIQAALDNNPAVFIPTGPSAPTQCQIPEGITLCSSSNHFQYNALYGNNQYLGYTGTGIAVYLGNCPSSGFSMVRDTNIDASLSSGTPTAFQTGLWANLINDADSLPADSTSITSSDQHVYVQNYNGTGSVSMDADGIILNSVFVGNLTFGDENDIVETTHFDGKLTLPGGNGFVTVDNAIFDGGVSVEVNAGLVVIGGRYATASGPVFSLADGSSVTFVNAQINAAGGVAIALSTDNGTLNVNGNVVLDTNASTITGTASGGVLSVNPTDAASYTRTFGYPTTTQSNVVAIDSNGKLYNNSAPSISAANMTSFPTFNQNTTGSAAKITSNGTANQVWGMNSGGSAQGWQTAASSSKFPYKIFQSDQTQFASGTSWTYTFPNALQSSGATAMLIFAADASGSFTGPSGWTCSINVSSGTNYPRLVVCIVASAGQTTASFSVANTASPSLRFYELGGTRTFDITSGTQYTTGSPTTIGLPSITPTSGAAVWAICTAVGPNSTGMTLVQLPLGRPDWSPADVLNTNATGRVLLGGVYDYASDGTAIQPPQLEPYFSAFSGSGLSCATFSIK
jgi:hypothetical protein